ncbi:MAG: thioredoxin fold domain-containing protein [Gammaproteobacteria bacterium]|nr:thioredoxin fold domain-containing protein [Gammaproteobacteria bacterium]MDH3561193.1 thioredoxin fold domain-containing protein [Gammaproteobacteria bacterium]
MLVRRFTLTGILYFSLCTLLPASVFAVARDDFLDFDDQPLQEPLAFPEWFKLSFLDLSEDLKEAQESGKHGLLVYYGQKYCAYCKQFLEKDLAREDIQAYTLKHFDVIGIDIHGDRTVVDLAGGELTERELAIREQTNFTPAVVFYNNEGKEVLRLRGYYPPYRFRAALEYVADGHYSNEPYREYLARADVPLVFEPGDLNEQSFFMRGPMMLDRSRIRGERPLVVFFEQGNCHACDVLHGGPLQDPEIRQRISRLEAVQLSFWGDTPVITPAGERTTSRKWAESLGLFYTPTLIIYDNQGLEIIRVDSVVQFYRLRNILDYVLTEGYRDYPTFQSWRASRNPRMYLK